MYSILMIDDDKTFCDLTSRYLSVEGFKVTVCHNPQKGIEIANSSSIDLILLDVMMPEANGFDVLQKIRENSKIPVIICTALDDDINEIVGLETGADGYIKKCAHPRVMLAKINSVLRRTNDDFTLIGKEKTLTLDNLEVNLKQRTVQADNEKIDLTTTEFNILAFLLDGLDEPKSKKDISHKVLGKKLTLHDRSVDTHISRLRTKLGNRPNNTARIKTVQGFGYQWNIDD